MVADNELVALRLWQDRGDVARSLLWPDAVYPEHWREDFDRSRRLVRLAILQKDALIGSLGVKRNGCLTIYIQPDYCNRGLGRSAMALASRWVYTHYDLCPWLYVASDNIRARRSYVAAGFIVQEVFLHDAMTWARMIWSEAADKYAG